MKTNSNEIYKYTILGLLLIVMNIILVLTGTIIISALSGIPPIQLLYLFAF